MIKKNYIVNVLNMSAEDYDLKYPNTQKICNKRYENIKLGVNRIDDATGLTRYEFGQQKARKKLKKIDPITGLSGYDQKGQATRAAHMSKIDEYGRNGYSRIATKAIIKGNRTKADKGLITNLVQRNAFRRYKSIVTYVTNRHRKELTAGYVTGLAGNKDVWHLDHRISIFFGFINKISPFVIGHKDNLQMLPWEKNISKHSKCDLELETLLVNINYTLIDSVSEYNAIIDLINLDISNNIPTNAAYLLERYYESKKCS
jgi:hypothetical protein